MRRISKRIFQIGLIGGIAGLVALVVAVAVAMSSLPSYEAMKSSPNGQMIRVHAADGTVIVSLGPSFGKWLPYDQIPDIMVDAMVSVEDKRYYMHPGVDPIGLTRAAWLDGLAGRPMERPASEQVSLFRIVREPNRTSSSSSSTTAFIL